LFIFAKIVDDETPKSSNDIPPERREVKDSILISTPSPLIEALYHYFPQNLVLLGLNLRWVLNKNILYKPFLLSFGRV